MSNEMGELSDAVAGMGSANLLLQLRGRRADVLVEV
jgi:hypothetical protein